MPTKDTSFKNKMIDSIKNIEKYPEMATRPFGEVIKYFILLVIILTLFAALASTYVIGKGIEYFKTQFPDLSFSNNQLYVDSEKAIEIVPKDLIDIIIVNTNELTPKEIDKYTDEVFEKETGVLMLKDKMILNIFNQKLEYTYDTFELQDITKAEILEYFTGSKLISVYASIFVFSFIYTLRRYVFYIIVDVMALSVLGYITSIVLRLRLRFAALTKFAMYSLTLPIILNIVYIIEKSLLGFDIKFFEVMYITIAYIYIVSAILMVKSDLIKRGQELSKIIEEEEKVKEELEKQKEEEQEDKEQENKQEENEKQEDNKEVKKKEKKETTSKGKTKTKKEKKEKEEDKDGEEPQGENA